LKGRYIAEKWMLSEACRSSEAVIFPSDGCAKDLNDSFGISSEKTLVIWNPVDCVRVRRQSWQQVDAVSAWKLSVKSFRMVHVGRLDGQKNHELLLQVCSLLQQNGREFSLAIIGEGLDRAWIEQQIQERGLQSMVFLAGEQQNPFPWMAAADVLLLTSHFEAFALVLVEAMVCGTAVISTDCPSGPSEVLADGEYGLLAPNGDCDGLAAAVELVMDDEALKERLVKRGYRRAQDYDAKKIGPEWEALINTVPHRK
jgi:glycosyltransferase involved in cell wall biosynthesis